MFYVFFMTEGFVPCSKFYDDSINYFEMQRLGGLLSHLKKTHKGDKFVTLSNKGSDV